MPGFLLHTCCGPCASAVLERLRGRYKITCFFYNPNIHPVEEYRRRLDHARRVARIMRVGFEHGEYDVEAWFESTKGREDEAEGGGRCEICFRLRMLRTAQRAREVGAQLFGTTLTISPHKNARLINRIGEEISEIVGVPFLKGDWKKKDGFNRSVQLSREHGIFRQDYCGCEYSRRL